MANKNQISKQERLKVFEEILKNHDSEKITFKEISEKSGYNSQEIYNNSKDIRKLADEYNIEIEECRNKKGSQKKDYEKEKLFGLSKPLKVREVEEDEIISVVQDSSNHTKIVYLRDLIWTVGNAKPVPQGFETYWLDGKIHASGETGCCLSNIGIRKIDE